MCIRDRQTPSDGGGVLAKSRDLVCEKRAVIFAAIADWVDTNSYPVNFMCEQLGVSTSGYYKWRSREPSAHETQDAQLTRLISHFFKALRGNPAPHARGARGGGPQGRP